MIARCPFCKNRLKELEAHVNLTREQIATQHQLEVFQKGECPICGLDFSWKETVMVSRTGPTLPMPNLDAVVEPAPKTGMTPWMMSDGGRFLTIDFDRPIMVKPVWTGGVMTNAVCDEEPGLREAWIVLRDLRTQLNHQIREQDRLIETGQADPQGKASLDRKLADNQAFMLAVQLRLQAISELRQRMLQAKVVETPEVESVTAKGGVSFKEEK